MERYAVTLMLYAYNINRPPLLIPYIINDVKDENEAINKAKDEMYNSRQYVDYHIKSWCCIEIDRLNN
jgi:hypothetical protein